MTSQEIKETIAEQNPQALFADDLDDAIVGYVERCGSPACAVYDEELCIKVLAKQLGCDEEGAREYYEFNTKGAYVGVDTPYFFTRLRVDEKV
jgi:hypothetical protein